MSHHFDYIDEQLQFLEKDMEQILDLKSNSWQFLETDQRESAQNFIRYLTLRSKDIRNLQDMLHEDGLSSLASSESHILRQIQNIRQRLGHVYPVDKLDVCSQSSGRDKLFRRSNQLFGKKSEKGAPHLMVTFDMDFASDLEKVKRLLQKGMGIARINCAHDTTEVWQTMIKQIKKACKETALDCKIYMDLAGPKIRTKLLDKGREKGKTKIQEGNLIWMAEEKKHVDKKGVWISPGEKGIINSLLPGDRVYIDDGMIRCVVENLEKDKVGLNVQRVSTKKNFIKDGKGINFPDSSLNVPSLTDYDKSCLPFICKHADLIGYSFVRSAEDVEELRKSLVRITPTYPHLILKIETREAVDKLPELLLEALKEPAAGVMIARGDLAVEIGFERLSEIQEEILWICEAAHLPVIWATQVLESLHKFGLATRSEITDATHAGMAECIMINKGPYTEKVLDFLRDILKRRSSHRIKKRFVFRPLKIAERFINS